MRIPTHALVAFATATLIYGAAPLAQGSRPVQAPDSRPPQTQTPDSRTEPAQGESKIAMGQLMRVDTDAMTIAIQSSQGGPMVFRYTETTKVLGGERGVAGLATMTGEQITIRYVQHDNDNVASEIEIGKKG